MARVFISYKRADKEKVFPLKDKIEKAIGEPCWIDVKDIVSDGQYVDEIIKAIEEAEIFLFMYSNAHTKIETPDLDYTIRELSYAYGQGKRVVFINIDKTPLIKWLDFMYKFKQQVDATSEESFGKLLEDLKGWLEVKAEPEAVEKSAPAIVKKPESKPKPEPEPEAVTEEAYTEGLEYEFDDEKLTATVKGIGTAKGDRINIPPVVEHNGRRYGVTVIGVFAFEKCTSLTAVIIPNSVTKIGSRAFTRCTSLTSVTIPNSVTEIGPHAFMSCYGLSLVTIPSKLTVIMTCAFKDCSSLNSVTIPSSVKKIEWGAFKGCSSLKTVAIPNSVEYIAESAFAECDRLESVEIPSETGFSVSAFPKTCKVKRRLF